jgi:hypothetical protein
VWGREEPVFSINWVEPSGPADSGFTVLFDDAPDPDEVESAEHPGISLVCLSCLLDDHPEIQPGLYIAREYGLGGSRRRGRVGRG